MSLGRHHLTYDLTLGRLVQTASQVALVVKNPPANAGDVRDGGQPLGLEDALEEDMATHSSILVWRIPWIGGAWLAIVHRVAKSRIQLKRLSMTQVGSDAHLIYFLYAVSEILKFCDLKILSFESL